MSISVYQKGGNGHDDADGTFTVHVNVDTDLAADYSFTVSTVGAADLTAKDFHL